MSGSESIEENGIGTSKHMSGRRKVFFGFEIGFILLLLAIWLSSESIRQSKHLIVLFLYSFPCQFLIAIVPHEPVYLYFSKFYQPITVTLVSVAGTVLTEWLNYSTFQFITDLKSFAKVKKSGFVGKLINIFQKAPFLSIWIAGFTPVPFYPFRFLVVLAKYPVWKYLLAVFTSRTPRFFLLALLGHAFKIPDFWLAVMFILLLLIANVPLARKLWQKIRRRHSATEAQETER
ncbi:MAG: VTT domain-containing protein [Calditrichaeota bacterium]|nr:VTT domain-containing protein [Calditrichota bacterium]